MRLVGSWPSRKAGKATVFGDRLHHPRRHGDEQLLHLAAPDPLKLVGHRPHMPVRHQGCTGRDGIERLPSEARQVAAQRARRTAAGVWVQRRHVRLPLLSPIPIV